MSIQPSFSVGTRVRYNTEGVRNNTPTWQSKGARFVLIQPPFYAPQDERYDAHGWFALAAPVIEPCEGVDQANDPDAISDFRSTIDYNGPKCIYLRCDEIAADLETGAEVPA